MSCRKVTMTLLQYIVMLLLVVLGSDPGMGIVFFFIGFWVVLCLYSCLSKRRGRRPCFRLEIPNQSYIGYEESEEVLESKSPAPQCPSTSLSPSMKGQSDTLKPFPSLIKKQKPCIFLKKVNNILSCCACGVPEPRHEEKRGAFSQMVDLPITNQNDKGCGLGVDALKKPLDQTKLPDNTPTYWTYRGYQGEMVRVKSKDTRSRYWLWNQQKPDRVTSRDNPFKWRRNGSLYSVGDNSEFMHTDPHDYYQAPDQHDHHCGFYYGPEEHCYDHVQHPFMFDWAQECISNHTTLPYEYNFDWDFIESECRRVHKLNEAAYMEKKREEFRMKKPEWYDKK